MTGACNIARQGLGIWQIGCVLTTGYVSRRALENEGQCKGAAQTPRGSGARLHRCWAPLWPPSLLLCSRLGRRPCRRPLQRDAPNYGGDGAQSNQDGDGLQKGTKGRWGKGRLIDKRRAQTERLASHVHRSSSRGVSPTISSRASSACTGSTSGGWGVECQLRHTACLPA